MGRRLRRSSATSGTSFTLPPISLVPATVKLVRDAPSNASPARTALPAAHFDRNKTHAISGTGH
jgi:hypothetical protein